MSRKIKPTMKRYEVIVEATEKVEILVTIYAQSKKEVRKKLTGLNPWNKTDTEDEIRRIELDNWKIIIPPKEITDNETLYTRKKLSK